MISANELDWCFKRHCEESFFGSIVMAQSHFSGIDAIHKGFLKWIASTITWSRNDELQVHTSLRGVCKHDEAIHMISFMDCHAHIRSLAMTFKLGN